MLILMHQLARRWTSLPGLLLTSTWHAGHGALCRLHSCEQAVVLLHQCLSSFDQVISVNTAGQSILAVNVSILISPVSGVVDIALLGAHTLKPENICSVLQMKLHKQQTVLKRSTDCSPQTPAWKKLSYTQMPGLPLQKPGC